MRVSWGLSATLVAALVAGCGGSDNGGNFSQRRTAPQLDQDYAPSFGGTWYLTMQVTVGATSQTASGEQTVTPDGRNAVLFHRACSSSMDLRAVVTSAGHLDFDPTTCTVPSSCGTVTISFERGTADLAQGRLTGSLDGTASGCGQSFAYTFSFTGQLQSGLGRGAAAPSGTAGTDAVAAVAAAAAASAASSRAP